MSRKKILLSTTSVCPVAPTPKDSQVVSITTIPQGSFKEGDIVTWAPKKPGWWTRFLIWARLREPIPVPRYVVTEIRDTQIYMRPVKS